MKNPIISIIVPIYNVDKYLRQCLNSIRYQTFEDWECILVDDGSTDESPAICDEFVSVDVRFKVIHKENGGLSSARNAALNVTAGQYIGFVDADDWIEPEMFEKLYNLITESDADMAMVGFKKEYRGRQSSKHLVKHKSIIDGYTAIRAICYDRFPSYVWNKLHKKEIINCDFPDGRNFEDIYVYGQWLKNVNKLVIDPTPLYHYRMRTGSIAHVNPGKNRYDFFISCIDRMQILDSLPDSIVDEDKKNAYINKSAVLASKRIARQEPDKEVRFRAIKHVSDKLKEYPLPSIKKMNLKVWFRANLLRNHPNSFSFLMRAVHVFDLDTKHREKLYYE